jgi:hypothetical protein
MEASIKAFRGGTGVLFAGPGLDAPEHRERLSSHSIGRRDEQCM